MNILPAEHILEASGIRLTIRDRGGSYRLVAEAFPPGTLQAIRELG